MRSIRWPVRFAQNSGSRSLAGKNGEARMRRALRGVIFEPRTQLEIWDEGADGASGCSRCNGLSLVVYAERAPSVASRGDTECARSANDAPATVFVIRRRVEARCPMAIVKRLQGGRCPGATAARSSTPRLQTGWNRRSARHRAEHSLIRWNRLVDPRSGLVAGGLARACLKTEDTSVWNWRCLFRGVPTRMLSPGDSSSFDNERGICSSAWC